MYLQQFFLGCLKALRNVIVILLCFSPFIIKAQTVSTFPIVSRTVIIDSLNQQVLNLNRQKDSLRDILKNQRESISTLEDEKAKLDTENKNLKTELNGALGDNLQSSHTKSILFVFNVIVDVFLLIAIIWMFSRKKNDPSQRSSSITSATPVSFTNVEGYDHKLERIEKLGNLREKGLLTDDEFNLQKKQILADRG